jgi:hypothetical protein
MTARPGEVVVFITRHDGTCAECGEPFFHRSLIRVEDGRALCLACADLDHLEFLPRGDAALTRRASKHAPLRAVVVLWSRTRKRYERQGVLLAPVAIRRAEEECLADGELRRLRREQTARQREHIEAGYLADVRAALRAQFPGCPAAEVDAIAAWTCEKYSGRVGRSAAAKQFEAGALRLAVVAHVRHQHTDYDARLMRHGDRQRARQEVSAAIAQVVARWEKAL